jgi:methionyl-tRNA formyltransferase
MNSINVLFFGSTEDSVIVLNKLYTIRYPLFTCSVSAVVTQPAKPVGRDHIMTPTPVEVWAKSHQITVLSFPSNPDTPWLYQDEQQVIDTLESVHADLVISASYGQKIPSKTLSDAKFGGLNVHPSILPRWRGGDPVPWAIMTGDAQIGVTVVSITAKFDEGLIIAQKKIPILPMDTSGPLRTKLFTIGAELLSELLPEYLEGKRKGIPQKIENESRATRLSRDTGFEPWETIQIAFTDPSEAQRIERKFRALHPWPGLWSLVEIREKGLELSKKRIKIISCHLNSNLQPLHSYLILDSVQLEGKKPVSWKEFLAGYPQVNSTILH